MRRRHERWTEQDVALVEAKRELKRGVKTAPLEAVTGRTYHLTIPGLAQPGGSKQAFALYDKTRICRCGKRPGYVPLRRENGSIIINVTADNDARVKRWRKHIARIAHQEYVGPLFDSFLRVTFIFYQPRPKSHYTSTGKLSKQGIETPWPNVVPDTTKLVRAIEDELKGICYTDDAIIVKQRAEKEYGTPPRVEITIEELVLPEQQQQESLFGDLRPKEIRPEDLWETEVGADGPQNGLPDSAAPESAAATPHGTCDGGTSHTGHSQTQATGAKSVAVAPTQAKQSKGKVSRDR